MFQVISSSTLTQQGRTVLLEGLGSRQFCVSTPRLGDTKIFLVDQIVGDQKRGRNSLSVPKLRLRSSILKVNLRNLKVLWRLEENETNRRSTLDKKGINVVHKSTPRKQVNSNFGATCDFSCALHHQPVCGADKVLVSLDMN